MAIIPSSLILFLLSGLIAGIIILVSKNSISGLKIMLLGINITLFGAIFALKSNLKIGVLEYSIALLGLIICVVGFIKKD